MDADRLARYRDKLDHAADRAELFWTMVDRAEDDIEPRLACYKVVQEVAEALMDVAAMAAKDAGRPPKDDYRNAAILGEAGILSAGSVAVLEELNGLRNRLVHAYNGVDDAVALDSSRRLMKEIAGIVEELEAWISKLD